MSGRRHLRWVLCVCAVALFAVVAIDASLARIVVAVSSPVTMAVGQPPPDLPSAETVGFASGSGSTLRGWWVPPQSPGNGAVVLLHGIRSNRSAMLARARVLERAGFAVLLFDFQAHGESPGARITAGHLEALDAAAAVRFVRQKLPGEQVGVIGVSLGAAAALLGPKPLEAQAIVLESAYSDINRVLLNWLATVLGRDAAGAMAFVVKPMFDWVLLPSFGLAAADLSPLDRASRVVAPVMLAVGADDALTPPAEMMAMFERFAGPRSFWQVPGAGHVDLEQFAPEAYWAHVLPFLTASLRHGIEQTDPADRIELLGKQWSGAPLPGRLAREAL